MNNNGVDAAVETSWRGFIARMHLRSGGSVANLPALQSQCLNLLTAIRQGDSCIRLATEAAPSPLIAELNPALINEPLVPPAGVFVLESSYLYLQRMWLAEVRVSRALLELNSESPLADSARLADVFERIDDESEPMSQQVQAIKLGLQRRLLLLTGGPGTGKTFTLARLMTEMTRLSPDLRIALAAPTGKAAARLSQALMQASPGSRLQVQTVHALLGMRAPGLAPRHGPDHPLPFDLVVIDEASMLGLELAGSLLQALPQAGRLILAGDGDQLASVDPGNVFADVLAAGEGGLRGALVRLTRNYRQQDAPGLAQLAQALQNGDLPDVEFPGVSLIDGITLATQAVPQAELSAQSSAQLSTGQPSQRRTLIEQAATRYRAVLQQGLANPAKCLTDIGRYRVLSAMRGGAWGSSQLSEDIDARIRRLSGASPQELWYEGRLIMLGRNLRGAGRVNGDIGLCCRRGDHLGVLFDDPGGDTWVPVSQLQHYEPAWCQTVHKSQGSEHDEVDLVIAPVGHALARREVVYTGVTRARTRVRIWGTRAALQLAARQPIERLGTVLARLNQGKAGLL